MSEGKELAAHQPGGAVAVHDQTSIPIGQQMAMMNEALTNPAVDPAKAREMFSLMREMMNDAKRAEFNTAKIAAKAEMPAIYKRGFNTHQKTKHMLYEDLQRATDPILKRHRLMLDFTVGKIGNEIAVTPLMRHENGYIEKGETITGPADTGPGRSAIQAIGSSISYLKRYVAEITLGIVRDGEDDDGRGGEVNRLLNDRQEGMVIQAQAEADAGTYAAWFAKLPNKDKAWMISTGRHAQLGGAPALPGAQPAAAAEPEPTAQPNPAVVQSKPQQTAEEWAEQFKLDILATQSRAALDDLEIAQAKALTKLRAQKPTLGREVDAAITDRRIDLDVDDSSGPADTQRGEGNTLFGED